MARIFSCGWFLSCWVRCRSGHSLVLTQMSGVQKMAGENYSSHLYFGTVQDATRCYTKQEHKYVHTSRAPYIQTSRAPMREWVAKCLLVCIHLLACRHAGSSRPASSLKRRMQACIGAGQETSTIVPGYLLSFVFKNQADSHRKTRLIHIESITGTIRKFNTDHHLIPLPRHSATA